MTDQKVDEDESTIRLEISRLKCVNQIRYGQELCLSSQQPGDAPQRIPLHRHVDADGRILWTPLGGAGDHKCICASVPLVCHRLTQSLSPISQETYGSDTHQVVDIQFQ
jgi:hypothetical protein